MDNIIDISTKYDNVKVKKGRWKEALLYGMLWFCHEYRKGKRLVWLPEYDKVSDWLESLTMPHIDKRTEKLELECHANGEKEELTVTFDQPIKEYHGKGILLLGSCGQGKSFITRDILPRLFDYCFHVYHKTFDWSIDQEHNPIWHTERVDLSPRFDVTPARKINSLVDDDGHISLLNRNADFQVIDDLGEEGERMYYGTRQMVMADVMDAWSEYVSQQGEFFNNSKIASPLSYGIPILTTNLQASELNTKYGDRFTSRIKRCFSHVVVLQGDDLSGSENDPLDISVLPFFDDWVTFKDNYPEHAKKGFLGYLWGRMHILITATNTDEEVAQFLSDYDAARQHEKDV